MHKHPLIETVISNPSNYRGIKIKDGWVTLVLVDSKEKVTYTTEQLIRFFNTGNIPIDVALKCIFNDGDNEELFTFVIPVQTTIIKTIKADFIEEAYEKLQEEDYGKESKPEFDKTILLRDDNNDY